MIGRLVAERGRNHQSDRDNDREEPNAKPGDKKCGAKHKHCARVANFQLVLQKVAFDSKESESRSPKAEAHEPTAHATLW